MARNILLLAGATGLVGRELIAAAAPATVHAFVRRQPEAAAGGVRWHQVDFAALPALPAAEVACCALGTTIRAAGSQAAFRAVDHDAVLAFAIAARAAGVKRFAVVSALGANPNSAGFYNRVKGEMETALQRLDFKTLVIARPSLLVGNRDALGQPKRLGERAALLLMRPLTPLIPLAWRPIEARCVARAMLAALRDATPGLRVLESAELQRLGA